MLGLTREQTLNAVSLAFVDGQALRTYRHAPNTGSRKSWAAGDATSRAVRLALIAQTGEMGYPSVLTAKTWGFYDVSFRGQPFKFQRPYGSYVMENVLFKISFPAEFHSQTAVEAAVTLHSQLAAAARPPPTSPASPSAPTKPASASSTSKARSTTPPTATTASSTWSPSRSSSAASPPKTTTDSVALDPVWGPRIDHLRAIITCVEDPQFTADYHDPDKRSIANALTVHLTDGTVLPEVIVEYPIGHRLRRADGIPLLLEKFKTNLDRRFSVEVRDRILEASLNQANLEAPPSTSTSASTSSNPSDHPPLDRVAHPRRAVSSRVRVGYRLL